MGVVKQKQSDEEVICLSSPGNKDVPVYRMVDSGMLARIESMHARIESVLMTRPGMTGVTQQPSDPQPGCSHGNDSNDSLSHFRPRHNKRFFSSSSSSEEEYTSGQDQSDSDHSDTVAGSVLQPKGEIGTYPYAREEQQQY